MNQRYLIVLFGVALAGLALVAATVAGTRAAGRSPMKFQVLFDYQLRKIVAVNPQQPPDTVFVGDSSLGNSIDAGLWDDLSGGRAINLALTGAYGLQGSLAMIERVLRKWTPRNIVIMQTSDIMMRDIPPVLSLLAQDRSQLGPLERLKTWWLTTMNMEEFTASLLWLRHPDRDPTVIRADYVRQGPPLRRPPSGLRFSEARIRPDNVAALRTIAKVCQAHGVRCIYVNGPITDAICSATPAYYDAVAAIVRDSGLVLGSPRPPCITAQELGDTENHVRPQFRAAFTRRYWSLLSPLLAGPASAGSAREPHA